MQTRKQFLKNALAVASGTSLLTFDQLDSFAFSPNSDSIFFDFHSHPGRFFAKGTGMYDAKEEDSMIVKTMNEMTAGHLTGAFFALVADAPLLKLSPTGVSVTGKFAAGDGWKEYKRQLGLLQDLPGTGVAKLTTEAADLNTGNKKVSAYIAVEGGDFLEGQVNRLEEAYHDGIRSVQLVHYAPNDVGDLQTSVSTFNGLSTFGKEVVKNMNTLGMAIDVAHASYQTVKDVANITDAPIILSHSILEMETDRPISKRAISKEHAKLVAETGGVIGAWPSGFNKSFEEYVDNIKRLADVVGIDHVGVGTDMDGNYKPVLSSYTQYPQLAEALKSKGFSQTEVGMIMGENAKVVLSKIFKMK